MKYEPYEFRQQDAYDFARHIGAVARPKGDELQFQICPYCRPKKDRGTFSINLKTGQFKCLRDSCGVHGNMITLSKDFDFSLGNEVDEYYRPKKVYRKFKTPEKPIEPKQQAIEYLNSRGITEEVAKRYEITVQKEHENILVFPFYDEKGILTSVKYRKTDFDKEKDKNKEWFEKGSKPILFGMKQCNADGTLIITEGQLDSLSVAVAGYENSVSVPTGAKGFTWIPYCWDWIAKFKTVIVFGDYEKGHISLLDDLSSRLSSEVRHVREEDYKDCKDANDILRKYGIEQIKVCIDNAVAPPVKCVKPLSEVAPVDIFKLEKLKTGLSQIDRILYGGLPFGGVHIISGKPGEGKSTLASQILINAIEQGYKVFAYSGELPNYLFKAWMDFQIAGQNHILETQNRYGDLEYGISNTNMSLIARWYEDKAYVYESNIIESDEKEDLVNKIEETIKKYGVRVILLDNLMTAIDLVCNLDSDKYEKQSQFVKKLARIAIRYNVLILLVAHKRKNNFSTNENDEISGSGDISNLATITIAYEKGKDLEESQRLIKISKNRLFGKVNTSGWVADFNEKSKRIYINREDLEVEFGWNNDSGGFYEINTETPFD